MQSDHGVRDPQKTCFEAYVLKPLTWSNGGEGGKRGSMVERNIGAHDRELLLC